MRFSARLALGSGGPFTVAHDAGRDGLAVEVPDDRLTGEVLMAEYLGADLRSGSRGCARRR
ncbi:MAG: hypothetical protein DMD79_02465 [Candidatus Rokuibacteriota bacterium]|nr:MAG: hypothetical protein DMD79_02465 [Candidatus Rokubacteria bacterium]